MHTGLPFLPGQFLSLTRGQVEAVVDAHNAAVKERNRT